MYPGTDQKGAAMIAVLCIMAVFAVLAFTLLLTAAAAALSRQRTLPMEKCKIMAVSLSDVLTRELGENGEGENSLQSLLHSAVAERDWEESSEPTTVFEISGNVDAADRISDREIKYFEIPDVPQDYQAEIAMAWGEQQEEQENTDGSTRLYIAVTCSLRGQIYRVKSRYVLLETGKSSGTEWRWKLEWRE